MSEQLSIPDMEKIKQTSSKIQEICYRADANILILDDIIVQLEENSRSSLIYQSRLRRAKRKLNFSEVKSEDFANY